MGDCAEHVSRSQHRILRLRLPILPRLLRRWLRLPIRRWLRWCSVPVRLRLRRLCWGIWWIPIQQLLWCWLWCWLWLPILGLWWLRFPLWLRLPIQPRVWLWLWLLLDCRYAISWGEKLNISRSFTHPRPAKLNDSIDVPQIMSRSSIVVTSTSCKLSTSDTITCIVQYFRQRTVHVGPNILLIYDR